MRRRPVHRPRSLARSWPLVALAIALFSPGPAGGLDLAAVEADLAALRLDLGAAVRVENVRLGTGLATLRLASGVLVPATPVGGKAVEAVFVGSGRLELAAPDEVEAGQLEMFTGGRDFDAGFDQAVLVLGSDAAVAALRRRPAASPLDPAVGQRASALYDAWRGRAERKILGIEGVVVRKAAADPAVEATFAAWLRQGEEAPFLYVVDPDEREQVTLGSFVPIEASEREKRKIARRLEREQGKGRLVGLEVDDLGQFDTWLSAPLANAEGQAVHGGAGFEPERYTIDVELSRGAARLQGKVRMELRPRVRGATVVDLELDPEMAIRNVTDANGVPLAVHRSQGKQAGQAQVLLPGPVAAGETLVLDVTYSGGLVDREGRRYALSNTLGWHPRAGTVDRAFYDVTFHWGDDLELVAGGHRVGGGVDAKGQRWERRTSERRTSGLSFEVGKLVRETATAGHVAIEVAFDPDVKKMGKEAREEIVAAVRDSLTYFEELYGPYPLDELTVVTVPRDYSQSTLGMVTLSSLMMLELGELNQLIGLEDRRTVVAHELAHQWWGHAVGWDGYRDQWISEAMANYSALLFARHKLDWKGRSGFGPTAGWREALNRETAEGRPIEALGPVVLGARLASSHGDAGAYGAIVYQKGAVVLDMLARGLGEESFPKILRQIVKVVDHGTISTEGFFDLIERITDVDLDAFVAQFVYGTGLPEIYYTYRFEPVADGRFKVSGTARQQAPYRFRYRAVKTARGFDVERERLDRLAVASSTLVVPLEIGFHDPERLEGKKPKKGEEPINAAVRGHLLLRGEATPFELVIDHEPKRLWLDRDASVFGLFLDEQRHPKRMLYFQAADAVAAGDVAAAEALFARADEAEVEVLAPDEEADTYQRWAVEIERKQLDARLAVARARLALDRGDLAAAEAALDRGRKGAATLRALAEEVKLLDSRLDLVRGDAEKAFRRLRRGVLKGGGLDDLEGYALLAVAAHLAGHAEELAEARQKIGSADVDLSALGAP